MIQPRPSWWADAEAAAHTTIEGFTDRLRDKLEAPSHIILSRKNPYLFRLRAGENAIVFASMVVEAFLSSSEETIFGNALEQIAVRICQHARGGRGSGIENIDLEYGAQNNRTIVQIKSGPNWGNSSQRKALEAAFRAATRRLRTHEHVQNVRCIEGICYGRSETRDMGSHIKLIGHDFWTDISNWNGTAHEVMRLLGEHADNGLREVREAAKDRMVDHLRNHGAVVGNRIQWNTLLDLVLG